MKTKTTFLLAAFCVAGMALQSGIPDKTVFTTMEREHISARTPGLFAKSRTVEIHLDSLGADGWCFPLPGGKVISDYMRSRSNHSGVDVKTHANDTIRAAFGGVVRMSKPYYAYGKVVVVRHRSGLETVYSHNSRNLVNVGDSVQAGQPIALVGRTGRATTEHLHFETRIDGKHFSPHIIFNFKERTVRSECIRCTRTEKGVVVKPKPGK